MARPSGEREVSIEELLENPTVSQLGDHFAKEKV
jgi:hypothetical protein